MARFGTDPRIPQKQILQLRLPTLFEFQRELKALKKSRKEFPKEFLKTSATLASAYKRWAASYAPKEFGVLDKPRIKRRSIGDIPTRTVGFRWEINFWTDYAFPLEVRNWGPEFGYPYRPKTLAKFKRLGTPIGPHYAERAQKDFEKWLQNHPPKFKIGRNDVFDVTVIQDPDTPDGDRPPVNF